MALRSCVAVALAALAVIALAGSSVRAQQFDCAPYASSSLYVACSTYLQTPTILTPDTMCCTRLRTVNAVYGTQCYCQVLSQADPSLGLNMTKAYALPRDCNVPADMSNCPATPSAIPPPAGTPTPPAGLLTPPAGLITTPPGVTAPATPTPASGSSASSLALPIGATAGGLTGGGVIIALIWLIMSRCRIHLKWDLNAPCWCCYRSPKPHVEKLDNNGDKVPARTSGYAV